METLKIRPVHPGDAAALGDLFEALRSVEELFHPHPLTRNHASVIAMYEGDDLYSVVEVDHRLAGYGILRGWDDGYDVPSLGVAVHPYFEGRGVGQALMVYLRAFAKLRDAPRIRLKVEKVNVRAIELYERLGYCRQPFASTHEFLYHLELKPSGNAGDQLEGCGDL